MPPTRGSSWLRDWTHPMAPALQAASLPLSHQGSPPIHDILFQKSDKMWTFHYCFWFKNVELFLLCWANVILKNVWYSITHFCYCVDNIINKMNGLYNISNFFLKTQFSSVAQSCRTLCDPMDCSQAPLSVGFSRQEYWSGLPCPSPGDLPDSGTEPTSLISCA